MDKLKEIIDSIITTIKIFIYVIFVLFLILFSLFVFKFFA